MSVSRDKKKVLHILQKPALRAATESQHWLQQVCTFLGAAIHDPRMNSDNIYGQV